MILFGDESLLWYGYTQKDVAVTVLAFVCFEEALGKKGFGWVGVVLERLNEGGKSYHF